MVVNITKKSEIPSIPNGKLKLKNGIQKNFSVNWKVPIDLSNKIQVTKDTTNVKQEVFKTIDFKTFLLWNGVINKAALPIKGNIKIQDNNFVVEIIFKHFIGFKPMTDRLEICCSIHWAKNVKIKIIN